MSKRGSAKLLWGLGAFLLVWAVVGGMLLSRSANKHSILLYTRYEIQRISAALQQYAEKAGSLPEGDTPSIFRALAGSNSTAAFIPSQTNALGEAVDFWNTPYRIERAGTTNFMVRSAGKNKTFGDEDDVVLDSSK